jgi:glycine/D-amino acid oxidase-like deaminating enzyme
MSGIVIIGAGIIGCSTAYYLSESPRTQAQNIHLVEASPELFYCASGLAGGFMAADCMVLARLILRAG